MIADLAIAAGGIAKAALTTLAMVAVHGSVLALLALIVMRAGRLRPAWQAAVWLVVLAKFALPWGPAMPWSIADAIAMLRGVDSGAQLALPAAPGIAPVTGGALLPALGWLALAATWLAGAGVVLHRARRAHRATLRRARRAPDAPAGARALLAELATRVGVRTPRLAVGPAAIGPHVVGLRRPIIVVPPALLAEPPLLRAALLHELAHVRRRDALGRAIQLAARAACWWWPVVRLASRRLELAREAACDAYALETGELSRPAYARLLVQMSGLRTAAASALAAPHALDARIAAVLGPPARARLGWIHRLAILAWAALALGGARSAEARDGVNACEYTAEIAGAMLRSYPEADTDGDGLLSREEACDYQAALRRRQELEPNTTPMAETPLCCNCDPAEGPSASQPAATCRTEP